MGLSGRQGNAKANLAPGLLIVTGASHTGKTTVAEAVLEATPPPAALLSVDNILAEEIVRPTGDIWAEIPLAYELLATQLETLLDRSWFVAVESTFTYVPERGEAEFHAGQLERLIAAARDRGAPWLLVQLLADDGITTTRANETGRLAPEIVARTAELHRAATLPEPSLRLDTSGESPDAVARRVLAMLAGPSTS